MAQMNDKWLNDYDQVEKQAQEISKALNERSKSTRSSSQHTKQTTQIRTLLQKLSVGIIQLTRDIDKCAYNLTKSEISRRISLVNQLKTNEKQFEKLLREDTNAQKDILLTYNQNRSSLNEIVTENEYTRDISSETLMLQQDKILIDQDKGLETLSTIVKSQKQIAISIGNEVEKQNDLIDNIGDKVNNVNERLIKETRKVRLLDTKKAGTCGLWLLIILLLMAIIIIIAIPKPR